MRRIRLSAAVATVLLAAVLAVPGTSAAADVCTWGGTPAEPTGEFWIESPGLANSFPAARPLAFWAQAPLAGAGARCTGTLRIEGFIMPGSLCRLFEIYGTVEGVNGLAWFSDYGGAYSRARFYDAAGNLVGFYGANVIDQGFPAVLSACNGAGYTGGTYNATVELFR